VGGIRTPRLAVSSPSKDGGWETTVRHILIALATLAASILMLANAARGF
jgi:hypothetical protein